MVIRFRVAISGGHNKGMSNRIIMQGDITREPLVPWQQVFLVLSPRRRAALVPWTMARPERFFIRRLPAVLIVRQVT
jgi:hypothetical protein